MVHKIVQNNILNINYIIDYFKQQIHMKVDPVINNNDELFISNMAQMQKIKYLQTQKYKRESYIKDLQQSLTLNKQSLSNLAQNNQAKALKNLNQQNILLHTKLKKYYQDCMNVNALLLIEQQVRMEQKKFYNERSLQFQTKMIQLRKYLQDKEDSFSSVVGRLKKYEDLAEVTLQTKLHKLSNQLAEQHLQSIFKKIAEERDRYKMVFEKFQVTIQDLSFLKKCLDDKRSYEVMQHAYLKAKQQQIKQGKQDKGVSFYEKTKNTTNASNTEHKNSQNGNGSSANVKNPHIQLIKLLKKQKLNNQILQQAFNQAIQKNQQLIDQNSILVQANIQLQINIQKLESKGYILEQELTRYDKSLALKQQWKTKCDIDRQERIKEFQQKGQQKQICMIAMQEDMEKLSSFLITCVPKGNLVKSSSNPNFARRNQDLFEESDDFDIEQL